MEAGPRRSQQACKDDIQREVRGTSRRRKPPTSVRASLARGDDNSKKCWHRGDGGGSINSVRRVDVLVVSATDW